MADQQTENMQRAYAEVMLNMAKESAARVLVAEKRVEIMANEVAKVKKDGVDALVRLKDIMKAKIKEAESHSLAQVKNINQLQEKLHDAQNTVATLQVELQRANTELEQIRQTSAEERTNILPTSDKVDSDKKRGSRSKMHLQNKRVSLKNKTITDDICHVPRNAENRAVENLENLSRFGSDLPSFMTRNKKSELYRYGCAQRIHAVQKRSPSADSSLQHSSKQASALTICSDDTAGKSSMVEKILLESNFLPNCKRKRGRRSRRDHSEHMKTEHKSSHYSDKNGCLGLLQALESDRPPSNMLTGYSGEGLTGLKDDFAMGRKHPNICTLSAALKDAHGLRSMQVARRKRSKTICVFKDGCEPKSDNTSVSSNGTGSLMRPSDAIENLIHPSDSSRPVLKSTKIQIGGEGKLRVDHPECKTLENISGVSKEAKMEEISNLASGRTEPLIISPLDKKHNANASSEVSMQAADPRCIKYTFNRRKRKGVGLDTTPQANVPEKCSSLVSLADKEEPQVWTETQVLLEESLEDFIDLLVAQQLLVLSKMEC